MALQLQKITISQNDTSLFPPMTLRVNRGEIRTIMGPSGCGKSTLLAAICGSLSRTFTIHGQIFLNEKLLNLLAIEQRRVGILFQDDLLFPHMDVYQNLAFSLPSALKKEEKQSSVLNALKQAGLDDFAKRDVATLSGGQKARISLLRTLLAKPDALLLDEPFSKLDQELRQSFREFVYQQVKQLAIPALLVTHDPEDNLEGDVIHLTG